VKQALPFRVRNHECGYIMLTLMLMVALMIIATAAVLPTISYEIRRDREMEMIHRGVQYSRAIRNYYKKFGRYPTRLEDLDNTNNLRYLRKHYKDPITGKDFKLLHYGDPDVKLSMSFGGGTIPGANTVGQMNASGSNGSAFGGNSGFGSPQSSAFGGGSNSAFGGGSNGSFGGSNNSFGGGSNSFGGNSNSAFGGSSGFGGNSNGNSNSNSSSTSGSSGSDTSSSTAGSSTPGETSTGPDTPQASAQIAAGSAQGSSGQVFGGGPIVGVASISKENAFHEYNHKHKYNEWQFVYDPTADRGGLITTPYQPNLQSFANQLGQPGQNGQPGSTGTNNSPFGQSNGTGNSSGFGNTGTSGFGNGGFNSGFGNNSGGTSQQQPNPQQPQ
jgi:type II secretory pathway pseudopilin PulG